MPLQRDSRTGGGRAAMQVRSCPMLLQEASALQLWVKVVYVLGGTHCKDVASSLFLTRWQHSMRH